MEPAAHAHPYGRSLESHGTNESSPWPAAVAPGPRLCYLAVPGTMRDMAGGSNVGAQLRRGALEYCVLALLAEQPRYGFDLVRTLSSVDGMVTNEGTVYPLLSRLKREGYVETRWGESEAGPPRKYYSLTKAGRVALDAFVEEWGRFRDAVDGLLRKGAP